MRTNSINTSRRDLRRDLSNRRSNRRDFDIQEIEDTSNIITSANKFLKPNSFKNISQNLLTSMLKQQILLEIKVNQRQVSIKLLLIHIIETILKITIWKYYR